MRRFFTDCIPNTRSLDQIISDGDIAALAKYIKGYEINDKRLDLLYKTIGRCRQETYQTVCPVFCFLLKRRIQLDVVKPNLFNRDPVIYRIFLPEFYNISLVKLIFTYLPNMDIFNGWLSEGGWFKSLGLGKLGKRHAAYNVEQAGLQLKEQGHYAEAIAQFESAKQLLDEFAKEERLKLSSQQTCVTLADRTHKAVIDCYEQRSLDLHEKILACQQQSHANEIHPGCSR